jgi:hypothetical protein
VVGGSTCPFGTREPDADQPAAPPSRPSTTGGRSGVSGDPKGRAPDCELALPRTSAPPCTEPDRPGFRLAGMRGLQPAARRFALAVTTGGALRATLQEIANLLLEVHMSRHRVRTATTGDRP